MRTTNKNHNLLYTVGKPPNKTFFIHLIANSFKLLSLGLCKFRSFWHSHRHSVIRYSVFTLWVYSNIAFACIQVANLFSETNMVFLWIKININYNKNGCFKIEYWPLRHTCLMSKKKCLSKSWTYAIEMSIKCWNSPVMVCNMMMWMCHRLCLVWNRKFCCDSLEQHLSV